MPEEMPRTSPAARALSIVRFGPYELDLRSAELRKKDFKIRLQEQPFQILVALLECPGEVVLREEIRRKLWPDETVVVEFDHSINTAVKRLRDALCESAEKPRYIETLARRGTALSRRYRTRSRNRLSRELRLSLLLPRSLWKGRGGSSCRRVPQSLCCPSRTRVAMQKVNTSRMAWQKSS